MRTRGIIKRWLKGLIREVLEEGELSRIKVGKHTVELDDALPGLHVSGAVPQVKLEGTETDGVIATIKENAGAIEIDQNFKETKTEPRFIATDTATGGAERRFASSGGHAKIKDSADTDVMDLEDHRLRHETGGTDPLRLISQLTVLEEGITWVIDANRTAQIALPPGGQVQGTDTIQGDGNLLIFEV